MADYLYDRVPRGVRGAETALRLAESALEPSTYKQYGALFASFCEYCSEEGLSPLPAEPFTIFCYVGHLAEIGTWQASSLQPIFSAINRVHRDCGLEPPATGNHFLSAARAGMARAQVALATEDSRVPLPAEAVEIILADAEACVDADIARLRGGLAICLAYLFAGRQDSAVHLRSCDFGADASFIWLRLTEKGKRRLRVRRIVRLPLAQRQVEGAASVLPRVARLARYYIALRAKLAGGAPEFLFQLPGEARPLTRSMETWVAAALSRCKIKAPLGFAYQGHSLRSGGASAMAAIGVARHIYVWLGGWARGSSTVEKHYIDPTVLPSPAAYAFFGWALSRQYQADGGTVEEFTPLPDPLDEPSRPQAPAPPTAPPITVLRDNAPAPPPRGSRARRAPSGRG